MKLLFVYDHKYPEYWKDGLWWSIKELEKTHQITWLNLSCQYSEINIYDYDFILGWGAFGSPADKFMQGIIGLPRGLCLGGNAVPVPVYANNYQIIFYETNWVKENYLKGLNNLIKAFGVNTQIFKKLELVRIWDYLSVGAFSYWKHLDKMKEKEGTKLCIGEIQKGNMEESLDIVSDLVSNDIAVSGMLAPEKLNIIYNLSKTVYLPADVNGGGERSVLEARVCGCNVEVENPKLKELVNCKLPTEKDYFNSLNTALCEYA